MMKAERKNCVGAGERRLHTVFRSFAFLLLAFFFRSSAMTESRAQAKCENSMGSLVFPFLQFGFLWACKSHCFFPPVQGSKFGEIVKACAKTDTRGLGRVEVTRVVFSRRPLVSS